MVVTNEHLYIDIYNAFIHNNEVRKNVLFLRVTFYEKGFIMQSSYTSAIFKLFIRSFSMFMAIYIILTLGLFFLNPAAARHVHSTNLVLIILVAGIFPQELIEKGATYDAVEKTYFISKTITAVLLATGLFITNTLLHTTGMMHFHHAKSINVFVFSIIAFQTMSMVIGATIKEKHSFIISMASLVFVHLIGSLLFYLEGLQFVGLLLILPYAWGTHKLTTHYLKLKYNRYHNK